VPGLLGFVGRSSAIVRERLLPKVKNGSRRMARSSPGVCSYVNLCVSLHTDGSIGVRRFRRCLHCEKDSPILTDWYRGLPEIGSRVERTTKSKPGNDRIIDPATFLSLAGLPRNGLDSSEKAFTRQRTPSQDYRAWFPTYDVKSLKTPSKLHDAQSCITGRRVGVGEKASCAESF
jgi:hypothetical protein